MNVKRFMMIAGGAALLTTTVAQADFLGLSADIVGTDLADDGTWTARIYADLSAGSRLDAIYGNADPMRPVGEEECIACGRDTNAHELIGLG